VSVFFLPVPLGKALFAIWSPGRRMVVEVDMVS
jgi:hypothetical protein